MLFEEKRHTISMGWHGLDVVLKDLLVKSVYSSSLSHYKISKHLNKCYEHLSIAACILLPCYASCQCSIYANMSSFALSSWLLSNKGVLKKKNSEEIFFLSLNFQLIEKKSTHTRTHAFAHIHHLKASKYFIHNFSVYKKNTKFIYLM